MPRLPIQSGAYQSRAIIASAQRCVNLYPEKNDDPQAPVPVTHFQTPGLVTLGTPPTPGAGRCIYRATNGQLFCVVGVSVYYVSELFAYTKLGEVTGADITIPVKMADNGFVI